MSQHKVNHSSDVLGEDAFEHIDKDEADDLSSFADLSVSSLTDEDETMSLVDVHAHSNDKGKRKLDDDVASLQSHSTTADDLLDVDVDPPWLLSCINTVIVRVEGVVHSIGLLREKHASPGLESLGATCHALFKQLCELESIAASYVSAGEKGGEQKVDPAVLKWTHDVQLSLLEIGSQLERLLAASPIPSDMDFMDDNITMRETDDFSLAETLTNVKVNSKLDWNEYRARLNSYKERLDEFLPVLQADLCTYHTTNMQFASLGGPSSQPTHPSIPMLRRELYRLKDTLGDLHGAIRDLKSKSVADAVAIIVSVLPDIEQIRKALTIYLSNHGSDWLDSLLAGGLCFSEFRSLDLNYLIGVNQSLSSWEKDISFETRMQRIRVEYQRSWDSDVGIANDEGLMSLLADIDYHMEMLSELKTKLKASTLVQAS